MKKKYFLILFLLLLTGCIRVDKTNENYDELIKEVLNNNKEYTNEVGSGYKFYVPTGLRLVDSNNNNQIFTGYDTNIYIYVDITSYYYKKSLNFKPDDNYLYYKEINNNDKKGFIEILNSEDEYFVKIVYNYAKVEVYTKKCNLNNVIISSTIILDSIDYNDLVIEKLLDDNRNNESDITYKIEKPDNASSNFSQYLSEYITEEEVNEDKVVELPDE